MPLKTPLPEKIDIIAKSTTAVYDLGFNSEPTGEYVNLERGLVHLNDQINALIDHVKELGERVEGKSTTELTIESTYPVHRGTTTIGDTPRVTSLKETLLGAIGGEIEYDTDDLPYLRLTTLEAIINRVMP